MERVYVLRNSRNAFVLVLAAALCGTAVLAAVLGAAGPEWAWRLVPGFGGAAVLWATVVAGLLDGRRSVAAYAV